MDGHFDIFFDILLKPPQPFTGLFCDHSVTVIKVWKRYGFFISVYWELVSAIRKHLFIRCMVTLTGLCNRKRGKRLLAFS